MKYIRLLVMAFTLFGAVAQAQEVNDENITSRVNRAFEKYPDLEGSDILVVSVNGYVMLAGQVLNDEQKQQASVAAAFASDDIRRLMNELEVVEAIDHSFDSEDQKILDQIVAVIPDMSPATIPVIHNGVVHLLGQVTREEGNEVATTISKMAGVKNIRLSYEFIQ